MIGPGSDGFALNGGVEERAADINGGTRTVDWDEMTSCPESAAVIDLCGEKTQTPPQSHGVRDGGPGGCDYNHLKDWKSVSHSTLFE